MVNIYWTPKETLQSNLLYYFIKWDYMVFLHLVKVLRYVFEDKCQIWTRFSEAEIWLVDLNGLHDLYDISTSGYYEGEKNQYGREEIFQNNEKSSEIDNIAHT